jgi:outer membrane protein assembly factor BamB
MRALALVSLAACGGTKPEHVYPAEDTATVVMEWGSPTDVRINELRGDPPAALELVNASATATVDLSGWTISVNGSCDSSLEEGARIAPDEILMLWNETNLQCDIGGSGSIVMRSPDGAIVDEVEWTVPFARRSWCRIPDATGAFVACSKFTPGTTNVDLEATKGLTPAWSWSFEQRAEALALDAGGRVWIGQPNGGLMTAVTAVDGTEGASLDLSALSPGTLEDPGWTGINVLSDGSIALASTAAEAIATVDPSTGDLSERFSTAAEGAPSFVLEGSDGTLYVSFIDSDLVVAYSATGSMLWFAEADAALPLHGAADLLELHGNLVVLASKDRMLTVLDPATGALVGTIAAPASVSSADIQPGTIDSKIEGMAWSEVHDVLFISELRKGIIKGYDTSDLDVLFDPALGWGYLGSAGWFGTGADELGAPQAMVVAPEADVLVLADIGNLWVNGYDLVTTIETLAP